MMGAAAGVRCARLTGVLDQIDSGVTVSVYGQTFNALNFVCINPHLLNIALTGPNGRPHEPASWAWPGPLQSANIDRSDEKRAAYGTFMV